MTGAPLDDYTARSLSGVEGSRDEHDEDRIIEKFRFYKKYRKNSNEEIFMSISVCIKKITGPAFTAAAVLLLSSSLYAESVFLKDGSIVEGKIVKETDDKVIMKSIATDVNRSDIIRTVYHNNYKTKKYITKTDGTVFEVYIVDEDRTSYTCRTKLESKKEIKILKDDVESISKKRVVAVEDTNRFMDFFKDSSTKKTNSEIKSSGNTKNKSSKKNNSAAADSESDDSIITILLGSGFGFCALFVILFI